MLEVLSDELCDQKADLPSSISSIQNDCARQYQMSVLVILAEALVDAPNVVELDETVIDLFEYCMRKVRHSFQLGVYFRVIGLIHR